VVGSGPASITVAADVRREGHAVTMFEAFHKPGGVLIYGIPEFRLPKAIVQKEIDTCAPWASRSDQLRRRPHAQAADLLDKDGYDAVFIGTGAGLPKFMNIEGENLVGVFSANEYLTRANLMKAYDPSAPTRRSSARRKVAVLGGGNVAMDAARTALRLGAEEVHLSTAAPRRDARPRRGGPPRQGGGREFHLLQNAKRILGDEYGCVTAPSSACATSWASRTPPAAAGPSRSPAASS
jgi:glutamate synthase (NADPH) small chain